MHFRQITHVLSFWKPMFSHQAVKMFIAIMPERTQDVYISQSHECK